MEKKIEYIVKNHEHQMAQLDKQYDKRFAALPTNRAGEVNGDDILKLNDWHKQWKEHLTKAFVQELMNVAKG
jgi:hypothetical protein